MLRERLSNRPLPEFFDRSKKQIYKKDEIIYTEDFGVNKSAIYGVIDGLVSIERTHPDTDEKFTTFVARPGDVFGLEDVVEGYYTATARVLTPSTIAAKELSENDKTAPWVFKTLARRIKDGEEKLTFFKGQPLSLERVSYALAELSVKVTNDAAAEAIAPVSHPTIGRVAGSSREAVGIKVSRLKQKGIAYQKTEGVGINDIARLLEASKLYKQKTVI